MGSSSKMHVVMSAIPCWHEATFFIQKNWDPWIFLLIPFLRSRNLFRIALYFWSNAPSLVVTWPAVSIAGASAIFCFIQFTRLSTKRTQPNHLFTYFFAPKWINYINKIQIQRLNTKCHEVMKTWSQQWQCPVCHAFTHQIKSMLQCSKRLKFLVKNMSKNIIENTIPNLISPQNQVYLVSVVWFFCCRFYFFTVLYFCSVILLNGNTNHWVISIHPTSISPHFAFQPKIPKEAAPNPVQQRAPTGAGRQGSPRGPHHPTNPRADGCATSIPHKHR